MSNISIKVKNAILSFKKAVEQLLTFTKVTTQDDAVSGTYRYGAVLSIGLTEYTGTSTAQYSVLDVTEGEKYHIHGTTNGFYNDAPNTNFPAIILVKNDGSKTSVYSNTSAEYDDILTIPQDVERMYVNYNSNFSDSKDSTIYKVI